jgi:excisionase family DNA binding protein
VTVLDAPTLLTLDEVAETLRLSRRTVERMVAADLLPALRVGQRAVRVDQGEFHDWLYAEDPGSPPSGPGAPVERRGPEEVGPASRAAGANGGDTR